MRITAGLLIIYRCQILLVQQRYDLSKCHLSIPKGELFDDEEPLDAAIRETAEETGVIFDKRYIDPNPRLLNINTSKFSRRLIYYIVKLPDDYCFPQIKIYDLNEILWAGMLNADDAFKHIQHSQLPILFHLNETHIDLRILEALLSSGYISKTRHPIEDLYIYNYTSKCKKEECWNEVTLWCRGIILSADNKILYHPIRKFFEFEQLYPEFKPQKSDFKIYEKKDGFLGIMYWIDKFPFLATRNSFISYPGIRGNEILYNKYSHLFHLFNPRYTYYFEIVFPNKFLVTDYGETEDLFLLGAYNNEKGHEIPLEDIDLPISRVKQFHMNGEIPDLMKHDSANDEGYVLLFNNNFRIKVKFPQYKVKYKLKYEKDFYSDVYTGIE